MEKCSCLVCYEPEVTTQIVTEDSLERTDAGRNCYTLPDGSCIGGACMHDPNVRLSDPEVTEATGD